ncbi:MAG: family 10 glycosylhydrolase [Flavobacterium sp.]|uniref:glycoside hydrolase family 10 protein n=1 Tax=Flavobacterium sp. TaxID=239 RepID=UPI003267CB38
MKKNIILIFTSLIFQISTCQCIQNTEFYDATPKRDLRGVFLTSVFNLDWPTNRLATPAVQQAELIAILDNLKSNNYNTVFLQVRPECDALYNSSIEPWSYRLTGTQGLAPNPLWDPLAFAITEAHDRGLDLHAWLNPYRVRANITSYAASANSILNTQPTWILTASNDANLKILNPGIPAVQDYITSIVKDISSRYDIDGIHFDDYFYPNGGMNKNQDNQTYIDNNPTNITNIADWRRNNVNIMIGKVYDAIQVINTNQNKNIVFGVSPFGIWKSGMPTGVTGNPSFSALYCDPIAWLNADKLDYLAPQLYWQITGSQDYIALSKWWNDQIKAKNKQLYVSQAYYRMIDASNWSVSEIQNQIIQNRATNMDANFGQIAYRYSSIKNNEKAINSTLNGSQYQYKSFAPPILGIGKDIICPNIPTNIRTEGLYVKWDTPTVASDGDLPVKYVVYTFDNELEALTNQNDGSKILDIVVGNQLLVNEMLLRTKYFVVSSLDKNNNEKGDFSQPFLSIGNQSLTDQMVINIYPNPFSDEFVIYSDDNKLLGKVIIGIYDLSGKQVFSETIEKSSEELKINPSNLKKGFYLGKIILENGNSKTFKVIKE